MSGYDNSQYENLRRLKLENDRLRAELEAVRRAEAKASSDAQVLQTELELLKLQWAAIERGEAPLNATNSDGSSKLSQPAPVAPRSFDLTGGRAVFSAPAKGRPS